MVGILAWIVVGLILTILLGIAGAFVGGFLASATGIGAGIAHFDLRTILVAIVGAIVLLFAYQLLTSASGEETRLTVLGRTGGAEQRAPCPPPAAGSISSPEGESQSWTQSRCSRTTTAR
jgi:uncharacterized membrane protein YeaQ/YmgE (transglycosylase-associated protein family)